MLKQCAWCSLHHPHDPWPVEEIEPLSDNRTTSTICPRCLVIEMKNLGR